MKIEIEIDTAELTKVIIEKLADRYTWSIDEKKDAIMKSINWAKMKPHVQEAILKMAAQKLFHPTVIMPGSTLR